MISPAATRQGYLKEVRGAQLVRHWAHVLLVDSGGEEGLASNPATIPNQAQKKLVSYSAALLFQRAGNMLIHLWLSVG